MITLVATGAPPLTPIGKAPPDVVTFAKWSPSVGSGPLSLVYAAGPLPTVSVVVWALGADGVWRADAPLALQLVSPGVSVSGCTPADEPLTYANLPRLVPITLAYAGGSFAAPPPPPPPVVYARTVLALGFASAVAAGTYQFDVSGP